MKKLRTHYPKCSGYLHNAFLLLHGTWPLGHFPLVLLSSLLPFMKNAWQYPVIIRYDRWVLTYYSIWQYILLFFRRKNSPSVCFFCVWFFSFWLRNCPFYLIVVKAIVGSEVMTYIEFFIYFFFRIAVVIVRWLENFTSIRNRQTIDLRICQKYTDDKKE